MSLTSWVGRLFGLRDTKILTAIYGGGSYAGKPVTVDTAMTVDAFFACVRLISSTIASLPLTITERAADGGRIVRRDHPLYMLLHDAPNADQTAFEFFESVVAHLCLWGNAFAEKTVSAGQVRALTLLRPDLMTVYRDQLGALRYRYSDQLGIREYAEDEIFHARAFGTGGDVGLSPISFGRQALGTAMAGEEAAGRTFANGLRPSGYFISPQVLTSEQREQARKVLIEPLQGSEHAGEAGLLEGGFTWQDVSIQPRDAELLLSRRHSIESVCRVMGVFPVLIGHNAEGTTQWGSGTEQLILAWYTLGLRPYLVRIEQAIKRSLIAPSERQIIAPEFVLEGLLRADSAGRAAFYSQMVQNGIYSRNDCRAKEGLPAVDGGDVLTAQTNLAPLETLGAIDPRAAIRTALGIEDQQ
jgi:HK97 family phage portal protein